MDVKELAKQLTFDETLELLYHLKHFEVIESNMSTSGVLKVTLRSDLS